MSPDPVVLFMGLCLENCREVDFLPRPRAELIFYPACLWSRWLGLVMQSGESERGVYLLTRKREGKREAVDNRNIFR